MTVFESPQEVILPSPYWVTFPEVIKISGALLRLVEATAEDNFELKAEAVSKALSPATRGLILNSPNNPTGAVVPEKTIDKLVDLCTREGIFITSDETYEHFVYEGRRHVSLAAKFSSADTGFAIVGSMSKTYAMTGWRIGYCIGHQDLIKKISQFQSHQSGNPVSMSQKAALEAFIGGSDMTKNMLNEYSVRRQMVLEGLSEISGFSCPKPYGAFYAFPDVSAAMKATGIETSQDFSKFLLQKAGVATVPGSAFGAEGFIRISYATSRENLQEALYRIKTAVHAAMSES
jgi:aspartate aminotransferase